MADGGVQPPAPVALEQVAAELARIIMLSGSFWWLEDGR